MATETNEETDGNQISSIFSIFNEMKTMMDDFRHGLPDFIEKIVIKKPDEQDTISLHTNPTNTDEVPIELTLLGLQIPQSKITGTKVPIIQMQIKVLQ